MDRVREQEYFDASFRENPNHWDYDRVPFRILKHLRTWRLIRDLRPRRVCEIGCAAGVFTRYLAKIADRVDAFDISQVAIDNNRMRNRDPRISFTHLDVSSEFDRIDYHDYDLVVMTEVINYLAKETVARIVSHVADTIAGPPAKLLLSTRLSDGDDREFGSNEYTFAELSGLLRRRFNTVRAAAVQLRDEIRGPAAKAEPDRPGQALSEQRALQFLYFRRRLDECSEILEMGAGCDDVEMVAWLLERNDVPA